MVELNIFCWGISN